ncbi:Cyclin A [Carpediemonas membranifera]|uniref:Cyclin A n=1 Tax=Carpediemonas membranifera TaxID=201153 RepID=A0A8J6B442_9EUKA|nr:Cyclin A [Carpediemonas membranifera]|eukprot:KAG9392579.1 Cyclin A [Carpediemonas membranifera]
MNFPSFSSIPQHFVQQKSAYIEQNKKNMPVSKPKAQVMIQESQQMAPERHQLFTQTQMSQASQEPPHLASDVFRTSAFGDQFFDTEEPIRDVDGANCKNDLFCSEYAPRIMAYLQQQERQFGQIEDYTTSFQRCLQPKMVTIVADWLLDVAVEYKLQTETYFLAINLMHRFLTRREIARDRLQLVGVSAIWIAAKYEECIAPPCDDFAYITDDTYTCDQIRAMEREILNTLDWEGLTAPTARTFLKRYCHVADSSVNTALLSAYLTELCQRSTELMRFLPSMVAASSVALSRMATTGEFWDATMQHYTGYGVGDMKDCLIAIHSLWVSCPMSDEGTEGAAASKKYARGRYSRVSKVDPPSIDFIHAY